MGAEGEPPSEKDTEEIRSRIKNYLRENGQGKGSSILDVHAQGGKGVAKKRKGGCLNSILHISTKCGQGGRWGQKNLNIFVDVASFNYGP